jgi:hypothetical protein
VLAASRAGFMAATGLLIYRVPSPPFGLVVAIAAFFTAPSPPWGGVHGEAKWLDFQRKTLELCPRASTSFLYLRRNSRAMPNA